MVKEKYSCFVFGEGGKDRAFLQKLMLQNKFLYHTKKWTFQFDNASGNAPKIVLEKCNKVCSPYDLVLCFIDLDVLKRNYGGNWKKEKTKLEAEYKNICIIWQIDNAEDEYKKVVGKSCKKAELNKLAKKEVQKFINSEFWHRILEPIRKKEKELDEKRKLQTET